MDGWVGGVIRALVPTSTAQVSPANDNCATKISKGYPSPTRSALLTLVLYKPKNVLNHANMLNDVIWKCAKVVCLTWCEASTGVKRMSVRTI